MPAFHRRHFVTTVAAATASLATPTWLRAQPVLKIGVTLPLSGAPTVRNAIQAGATADVGLDFLAGFQQAVAAERRGLPIEVLELDDAYKPEQAAANVEALARQDVVAISGLWSTEHAQAALPVAARLRLPVIGMRSSAAELRRAENPWAFHLKASDADELSAVLKTFTSMSLPRVGVLYVDGPGHRELLKQVQGSGASITRALAVDPTSADKLAAAAREIVATPGTQSVLLLLPTEAVVDTMMELRGRGNTYMSPVCTLSQVISRPFAESRERALNGLGVASPFSNPAFSRAEVAVRFREAMIERDLDALTRSFSAFEGFVYGSVITRTLVEMKAKAAPTRQTLAAALRGRQMNLGGLPIRFDERQVGHQAVHLLYKYSAEGALKA
ncbi:ABC transporter substrate-binding protein [Piscinibacter sp. HJYY11]|uniref:ABC transporter substrate-binding protein n=1 Tax=Piscinibacter sp. HJYY11 TaxID=2801333 RepID=UPI00191F0713|nr:ABC transporter substrate-binding protein [Piscinibacter sp. HJYY11]MBL0728383.1 ABC transporter substrate-binding protein [Piscinibacter sp. HJYY11]